MWRKDRLISLKWQTTSKIVCFQNRCKWLSQAAICGFDALFWSTPYSWGLMLATGIGWDIRMTRECFWSDKWCPWNSDWKWPTHANKSRRVFNIIIRGLQFNNPKVYCVMLFVWCLYTPLHSDWLVMTCLHNDVRLRCLGRTTGARHAGSNIYW